MTGLNLSKRKGLLLYTYYPFCNLILLLLSLKECSNLAMAAGSIVKSLPGFDGLLPFELETGYIGVDESEDVQLFYYFVKSEGNPKEDPLVLWLTGGPGCSSLTGLIFEIGPIKFDYTQPHEDFPKLVLNPHSWTKKASFIFLDLPVGTGFSYGRSPKASQSTDLQACDQVYEFLRKWLVDHPEFISNHFYVGGDSYSGIPVPIITQLISNGNDIGIELKINIKGYILGNPYTRPADFDYRIQFAHGMGIISDELYESLEDACRGEYYSVVSKNAFCLQNMQTYHELLNNVNSPHILEPVCPFSEPRPNSISNSTRFLHESFDSSLQMLRTRQQEFPIKCRYNAYKPVYQWTRDQKVREAIHVHKGSIGTWIRCNYQVPFTSLVSTSVPYHANLSTKGYRSLIYSGDHDWLVPFMATEAWIRSLNYQTVDEWRQWMLHDQVAGYTRTYANKMTYATVKGGGHTAPEYKPAECKAMFERWISLQPL